MNARLVKKALIRRRAAGPASGLSGDQSETVAKHQHDEDGDRQGNTQGQRLDRALALAAIAKEKVKPGKKAADHADQHDKDDELEHRRLQ